MSGIMNEHDHTQLGKEEKEKNAARSGYLLIVYGAVASAIGAYLHNSGLIVMGVCLAIGFAIKGYRDVSQ